MYLESPDLASVHPSPAEFGWIFVPENAAARVRGGVEVRQALAFIGGPKWPLLSLSSHWLWVTFTSL